MGLSTFPRKLLSFDFVLPFALVCAAVALGSAVLARNRRVAAPSAALSKPPELLSIKADTLLRAEVIEGSTNAPYHLIEFMDYQCPPCRLTYSKVEEALRGFGNKVAYDARNFPLSFHVYARGAAEAAELALDEGKLPQVHAALFTAPNLEQGPIRLICEQAGVSTADWKARLKGRGEELLRKDLELANQLKINATPTFFLTTPSGAVYKLSSVEDAGSLIR